MTDKRGRRAWIKVQLRDTQEAHQAATIVTRWKQARCATQFLTQAILMFDSLQASEAYPIDLLRRKPPLADVQKHDTHAVTIDSRMNQEQPLSLDDALDVVGLAALDFSAIN
jgi:hypothetical protein